MVEGEREDLVRGEPGAVLVGDAEAVCVAVEPEAELGLAFANEGADFLHAFGVRLRVVAAEHRIGLGVEDGDGRAVLGQQLIEITDAGAIHELHADLELGLLDGGEVDELGELLEVVGLGIDLPALVGADDGGLEAPALGEQRVHIRLDGLGHVGCGGRAVPGGELQSLILEGVVAGGHVDAADGLLEPDGVGDDRGGRGPVADERGDAVGFEDFGGGEAEFLAEEAGVAAEDEDGLALGDFGRGILALRVQVVGDRLGGEADVVEGEVAGDEAAPAAGAEFDGGGHGLMTND